MTRTLIASLVVLTAAIALGVSDLPGVAVDAALQQMLDDGTLRGQVAEAVRHTR
jgi:hypothetical protein